MNKSPEPDSDPEREPPNWFMLPIVATVIILIFVGYRFGCSTH